MLRVSRTGVKLKIERGAMTSRLSWLATLQLLARRTKRSSTFSLHHCFWSTSVTPAHPSLLTSALWCLRSRPPLGMFGNYLGEYSSARLPERKNTVADIAQAGVGGLKGRPKDEKRIKGAAPPARYTKASTSAPQDASGVRCQKCLKLGHYTYDCKNQQVYKVR